MWICFNSIKVEIWQQTDSFEFKIAHTDIFSLHVLSPHWFFRKGKYWYCNYVSFFRPLHTMNKLETTTEERSPTGKKKTFYYENETALKILDCRWQPLILTALIYLSYILCFSSANKCSLKVAHYAALQEQYDKAIQIYEQVIHVSPLHCWVKHK